MPFESFARRVACVTLVAAATFASTAAPVLASQLSVKPLAFVLNTRARTASLEMDNRGNEPMRVQISAYRWSVRSDGTDVLTATDDIIVFPSMIALDKGEHRVARIGTTLQGGTSEGTYRIVVEELPPAGDSSKNRAPAIAIRSRMVLSAFVSAAKPEAKPAINALAMTRGHLTFRLTNDGNSHYAVRNLNVSGISADNGPAFEAPLASTYVLAGAIQAVDLPITQQNCAKLKSVVVSLDTTVGTVKETLRVSNENCQ